MDAFLRCILAQSFAGWPYAREGGPVKSEDDPLDPDPPAAQRETLAAIRYLERTVTEAEEVEGLALRYGGLYGPGTSLARDSKDAFRETGENSANRALITVWIRARGTPRRSPPSFAGG